MATELEVVNQALALLGAQPVTSLTQNVKQATVASLMLPFSRGAVLRDVAPNFARRYIQIDALDPSSPPTPAPLRIPDFQYTFELPADCLRALWVKQPDTSSAPQGLRYENRFKVIGRYLGATIDPIELVYVTNLPDNDGTPEVSDYDEWDTNTIDALCAHLSMKMALPLTQSAQVMNDMAGLYASFKETATANDGLEGVHDKFRTESRLSGVRRAYTGWTG